MMDTLNPICVECLSRVCAHVCKPPKRTLSPRRAAVLKLLSNGLTNKEIATEMGLTEGSVKVIISAYILPLLGVSNRVEAARWAWENGALFDSGAARTSGGEAPP